MTSVGVCLDDVGLHLGVNEAAEVLCERGALSALSAMVGAPAWAQAVPLFRRMEPQKVDVGLHLDLTAFPLLVPARPLGWWMVRTLSRSLGRDLTQGLVQECTAQLQRFITDMGRWPSHIDGHQHVHVFPGVREALLQALIDVAGRQPGMPATLWLRGTARAPGTPFAIKTWIIQAMGYRALVHHLRSWEQVLHQADPAWTGRLAISPRLLGVYDFNPRPGYFQSLWPDWLRAAQPGDVLMVHASSQAVPGDGIQAARLAEFAALRSSDWTDALSAQGLKVTAPSLIL